MTLSTTLRSRRAFLTGGLGALAATATQALLGPRPAAAGPTFVELGGFNDEYGESTIIESRGPAEAIQGRNISTGQGLWGHSTDGIGVEGTSHHDIGVKGTAIANDRVSVHGIKHSSTGPSVQGTNEYMSNVYATIYGLTYGFGPGVFGENTKSGGGVSGIARGTGSGVYAQSDNGRGGTFTGKKGQLRLIPSSAANHPTSGRAGDIFLDASKRLWLCKGGTTWVRIA
jgi:hypothetical protein